jgi:septal ring factor EnvC (AmiA/AmiB activator)
MSERDDKNFKAIETAINTMYKDTSALADRIALMEKNIIAINGQVQTQKQLTAHVLGRGMGPTETH